MDDSDVRDFLWKTRKEVKQIRKARQDRDRDYFDRKERNKTYKERGPVFRSARWLVNNVGPNGPSAGGKKW